MDTRPVSTTFTSMCISVVTNNTSSLGSLDGEMEICFRMGFFLSFLIVGSRGSGFGGRSARFRRPWTARQDSNGETRPFSEVPAKMAKRSHGRMIRGRKYGGF